MCPSGRDDDRPDSTWCPKVRLFLFCSFSVVFVSLLLTYKKSRILFLLQRTTKREKKKTLFKTTTRLILITSSMFSHHPTTLSVEQRTKKQKAQQDRRSLTTTNPGALGIHRRTHTYERRKWPATSSKKRKRRDTRGECTSGASRRTSRKYG